MRPGMAQFQAMIKGETVELRNFGVFEVKLRKPRIGGDHCRGMNLSGRLLRLPSPQKQTGGLCEKQIGVRGQDPCSPGTCLGLGIVGKYHEARPGQGKALTMSGMPKKTELAGCGSIEA